MKNREYDVVVVRVVDGDTVDVDINLGFNIWLRNERVRIMGIDTPECRTSDTVEKLFGLAAKKRLNELCTHVDKPMKLVTSDDKNPRDKYGRILGDLRACGKDEPLVSNILIEGGYCVPYFGDSKDSVKDMHMINRQRLLNEGIVDREKYERLVANLI